MELANMTKFEWIIASANLLGAVLNAYGFLVYEDKICLLLTVANFGIVLYYYNIYRKEKTSE